MSYRNKIRCYSCEKPVMDTLYIKREVNPYVYVPICKSCSPTWNLIKGLERKGYIRSIPKRGVVLTAKGRRINRLLKQYKKEK